MKFGIFFLCLTVTSAIPFSCYAKYQDDESDLITFGYRDSSPNTGRWLSRDPSEESGGFNIYCFTANDPVNKLDSLGLWATDVHHLLVEDWLNKKDNNGIDYHKYPWGCCVIDVIKMIQDGSDYVDGVGYHKQNWCEAQSSAYSFQHAMRDGANNQTVDAARNDFNNFLKINLASAKTLSDAARESGVCSTLDEALRFLGRAYHSYSDSLSPAHGGFQPWWGPIDGVEHFGPLWYSVFVRKHHNKETMAVYMANPLHSNTVASVRTEFGGYLTQILAQPAD